LALQLQGASMRFVTVSDGLLGRGAHDFRIWHLRQQRPRE